MRCFWDTVQSDERLLSFSAVLRCCEEPAPLLLYIIQSILIAAYSLLLCWIML